VIRIERLTYTYPRSHAPALHDLSLVINSGELVLLTGASGSGKSTLLRCLNGLTPHFSGGTVAGTVEVAGINALEAGPERLSRLVGFVFQNPDSHALLDRVEAEIAFSLEQAGVPAVEMRLRVEEALDLMELTGLRRRTLESLSGGEKQRVAIAAALALRPRYLALDEPTSQLDPQSAEELLHALVRLNHDLGLTIVLAEQRLERVLRYADRLLVLDGGRLVVEGPPAEAIALAPQRPPLAELAHRLNWRPIPLTVKDGQRLADNLVRSQPSNSSPARFAPSAVEPLLEAHNLHFTYGPEPVLRGVSLNVGRGETVALLGRNGSGKSTLLRCLVGLLRPSRGEVRLRGHSIAGRSVAEICQHVAYLPQNPDDLLFSDSVMLELAATWANHGLDGKALPANASSLLEELGLSALADAYPRDLSTGQRQRVALGAVMITAPSLLLLDEPTRGLDYLAKHGLIGLWRRWQAAGMGLLIVTHDVELAARLADRVVVLDQGQVIAQGPAREILGASPLFAPQIARLFPGSGWLTVEEALLGLGQPTMGKGD
jgi:energy-coupling factor transport system ATP-binding protein